MKGYSKLVGNIGRLLEEGRKQAYSAVNSILVKTYWDIGREIVEYEQEGNEKAEYGSNLLNRLSDDLKLRFGRGFSRRNILDMRRFFLCYQKWQTVSAKLSWSHYIDLLSVDDDLERSFYENQCIKERWSVRQLKRQMNSALFHRIALSKNSLLGLDRGHEVEKAEDIIKYPYILEFLDIPEKHTEKDLEQNIIDNIQMFLLELGKGFTFVGRQYRISFGNKHFYIDLVFYHRILKCFVLIDLKIGEVGHEDVGQMNLYLNYFKKEEMAENDPIGIVLAARKNKIEVEYALGGLSNKLFVSKYKLYLPDKNQLSSMVRRLYDNKRDKLGSKAS